MPGLLGSFLFHLPTPGSTHCSHTLNVIASLLQEGWRADFCQAYPMRLALLGKFSSLLLAEVQRFIKWGLKCELWGRILTKSLPGCETLGKYLAPLFFDFPVCKIAVLLPRTVVRIPGS